MAKKKRMAMEEGDFFTGGQGLGVRAGCLLTGPSGLLFLCLWAKCLFMSKSLPQGARHCVREGAKVSRTFQRLLGSLPSPE